MTNVAIIPARGGSTRIPRKNVRDFHGHPIIAYSIMAAHESRLFDDVVVSTEDRDIALCAIGLGAAVLQRPQALAANDVGTQDIVKHALSELTGYDYACCIYATAPLITVGDLISGFHSLRVSPYPYLYTVGPDGVDAGQWYWGTAHAFLTDIALERGMQYVLPAERVCDINTEDDWQRAELMYDILRSNECRKN